VQRENTRLLTHVESLDPRSPSLPFSLLLIWNPSSSSVCLCACVFVCVCVGGGGGGERVRDSERER